MDIMGCSDCYSEEKFAERAHSAKVVEMNMRKEIDEQDIDNFHTAIGRGDTKRVKSYIKRGIDVNIIEEDIWYGPMTALMRASRAGRKEIVQLLIDNGADPFVYDNTYYTALRMAIGRKDIVEILLKPQADPKIKLQDIHRALSDASEYGKTDVVEILIKALFELIKDDEDTANFNEYLTEPLEKASSRGHTEIVEMLNKALYIKK